MEAVTVASRGPGEVSGIPGYGLSINYSNLFIIYLYIYYSIYLLYLYIYYIN